MCIFYTREIVHFPNYANKKYDDFNNGRVALIGARQMRDRFSNTEMLRSLSRHKRKTTAR